MIKNETITSLYLIASFAKLTGNDNDATIRFNEGEISSIAKVINQAVLNAIEEDTETKKNIQIILGKFPDLAKTVRLVVKENYPEYDNFVEKILVLI